MPIKFRNSPVREPLIFDSVGNHWNQEHLYRPKGYPLYHYLQTEQGCGRIIIQDKAYLLHKGEGVLIAPFIRHSYSSESDEWFTSFATFTGTMESSIAKILGNRQVIFVGKEQTSAISMLIADVLQRYENPTVNTRQLSVICYDMLMNFADCIQPHDLMEDPLYQKYIEPVVKEIETNYSSELTVAELSRLVYVTPQYLSRLFVRFLGYSAYEYLTTYRINKAKELLLIHSHMKVQEIARQVGFSDTSHFIAMFKKTAGVTPLEFRKLY